MSDAGFVLAAYAVIFGGLGAYALLLGRRVAAARARLERESEAASRAREDA